MADRSPDQQPQAALNTDRELYRERAGDYYADSIHVTAQGAIGIDCGGSVYVMPLREWHRLAGGPLTLKRPGELGTPEFDGRNPQRWRKRPVVITALQLRGDNWSEMCDFARVGPKPDDPHGCYIDQAGNPSNSVTNVIGMRIPTPEGTMTAREGDWIIRGVKGELYPCKPDIFDATYELADAPQALPPGTAPTVRDGGPAEAGHSDD